MNQIFKKTVSALVLAFGCYSVQAQEIDFKVGHLPNHNYTLTQVQKDDIKITYSASDEYLAVLEEQGVSNPTLIEEYSERKSVVRTGESDAGQVPIMIEILETEEPFLQFGAKIFGRSGSGKIEIDSFYAPAIATSLQSQLLPVMEEIFGNIEFPETKINPGESFESTTELHIPGGELTLDISMTTTYTLRKVESEMGFFDLRHQMELLSSEGANFKFTGSGEGTGVYDIEKQFFSNTAVHLIMEIGMKMEGFDIVLHTENFIDENVAITKANSCNGYAAAVQAFVDTPDLSCTDFREGRFISLATEEVPAYAIIRDGGQQVERIFDEEVHGTLEWMDGCSYRILYDGSKMELQDFQQKSNASGGVIVEVTEIKGRCFHYTATGMIEGEVHELKGIICKE